MFTGLVEELGKFQWLRDTPQGHHLAIIAPSMESNLCVGDSVAVNGCCLTVASHGEGQIQFDLLEETLRRTNLQHLGAGADVNLERALSLDGRLGGHFMQGHVDATTRVLSISEKGPDLGLEFEMPQNFARYIALKGSIAINGVSLTVAELAKESFIVWIIPYTRKNTNLGILTAGSVVNFECDILAKYAERLLIFP